MSETPPTEGGLLSVVPRLLRNLRDLAESRLELFLVEFEEERTRFFEAFLLAGVVLICLAMASVLIIVTLVMAFWEEHRVLVLALLTAAFAAGAISTFVALRRRLKRWRAFSSSLDQIKKDKSCFDPQS